MEECTTYDKKSLKAVQGKTADFNELAKDCVTFANAKGGCLHIGIEDDEELPPEHQTIAPQLPEKIVKRINELTFNVGIKPEIVTAENGGQYIRLQIFPSQSSVASTTKGQYFYRDNDSSRTLLPDELTRLMNDKPAYCWETKVSLELTSELQLQDGERMRSYVDELVKTGILITRGVKKGNAFLVNPKLIDNAKVNRNTTLKTIEPHRLKTLIEEDLSIYPNSKISDICSRLPDADIKDIRKMVYAMVKEGIIDSDGGNRNRTYSLAKKNN